MHPIQFLAGLFLPVLAVATPAPYKAAIESRATPGNETKPWILSNIRVYQVASNNTAGASYIDFDFTDNNTDNALTDHCRRVILPGDQPPTVDDPFPDNWPCNNVYNDGLSFRYNKGNFTIQRDYSYPNGAFMAAAFGNNTATYKITTDSCGVLKTQSTLKIPIAYVEYN